MLLLNWPMTAANRGGLGLKTGPGNFPMTLHPTGPAQAKSYNNFEITFLTRNNDRPFDFLLTPYRPTGHCPNASMASLPLVDNGSMPKDTV